MQIDKAIEYTRELAARMRRLAADHEKENARSIAARIAYQDVEALETVCDALEAERNRNAATKPADFLADSGGDERNGPRQGKHITDAQNAREGQKNAK